MPDRLLEATHASATDPGRDLNEAEPPFDIAGLSCSPRTECRGRQTSAQRLRFGYRGRFENGADPAWSLSLRD